MHTYVFYHRRSNDDSPRSYIEMTRVECRPSFRHVRAIHAVASMNRVRRTLSARYARNSRRLKANRYRRTSLDAPCLPRLVLHMQAPTFSPFFYFPFPRLSSLSLSHSLTHSSPPPPVIPKIRTGSILLFSNTFVSMTMHRVETT